MKKILVIDAHPDGESFCNTIANEYYTSCIEAGFPVKIIPLRDLNFSLNLSTGYRKRTPLEPDLQMAMDELMNADHWVFVYPNWWATFPALLKGFIDRVFLPGFFFRYRENSIKWDKLMIGKTARIIVTMDSPVWYYRFFMLNPGQRAIKKGVFEFCGVKPVKITAFGMVKIAGAAKKEKWLNRVKELGRQGK